MHIVGAEQVWLSRWQERPLSKLPTQEEVADLAELKQLWCRVRDERDACLSRLDEGDLEKELTVTTTKGARFQHTYSEMFRHLMNHSSYHRGQLVTLLRQLGAAAPATDLILFYRETKQ